MFGRREGYDQQMLEAKIGRSAQVQTICDGVRRLGN